MGTENWRQVRKVELTGKLIQLEEQARPGDLATEAEDVRVLLEEGFAHIAVKMGDGERVTVVPTSAVKRLTYDNPDKKKSKAKADWA